MNRRAATPPAADPRPGYGHRRAADRLVLSVAALLLALVCAARPAAAAGPSVQVRVTTAHVQTLRDTATAYGHVQPDPGRAAGVTLPRAGLIGKVWVSAGQHVTAGQRLLQLDTAPQSRMEYQQAQAAVEFARSQVKRMQELLKEQMATREQLANARHDLHDAQARLRAQEKLGAGRSQETVRAPFDAIVTRVAVDQGQRVQADALAASLAPRNALVVLLGLPQEIAARIKPGQAVQLTSVFRPNVAIETSVSAVHDIINPSTRLVDVRVPIPESHSNGLMLNESMQGRIVLQQEKALAVPRSAVLRDGKGAYLFVVRDRHAQRVDVEIGLQQGDLLAVHGPVQEGDAVVTLGNYELGDGMAVREAKP